MHLGKTRPLDICKALSAIMFGAESQNLEELRSQTTLAEKTLPVALNSAVLSLYSDSSGYVQWEQITDIIMKIVRARISAAKPSVAAPAAAPADGDAVM